MQPVIVRLTSIQGAPADPNHNAMVPDDTDKLVLIFSGPLNIQWPVTYADALDGGAQCGDLYEVILRKLPQLGPRIGQAPLV